MYGYGMSALCVTLPSALTHSRLPPRLLSFVCFVALAQLLTEKNEETGELFNVVEVSPNSEFRVQMPIKVKRGYVHIYRALYIYISLRHFLWPESMISIPFSKSMSGASRFPFEPQQNSNPTFFFFRPSGVPRYMFISYLFLIIFLIFFFLLFVSFCLFV